MRLVVSLAVRQLHGEAGGVCYPTIPFRLPKVSRPAAPAWWGQPSLAQEGGAEARNDGRRARWTRREARAALRLRTEACLRDALLSQDEGGPDLPAIGAGESGCPHCLLNGPAIRFQIMHNLQTCAKPLLDGANLTEPRPGLLSEIPDLRVPLIGNSSIQFFLAGQKIWSDMKSQI